MGLFNSGDMQSTANASLGGADAGDFASNEAAVPLPYCAGTAFRIAAQWISDSYNKKARPIVAHGPKGFSTTTGYAYSADIAAEFCYGSLISVREIWANQQKIWSGNVTNADGAEYADITTTQGIVRIYWGSETQPIDDLVLGSKGHPAYRGKAYAVFYKFNFGNYQRRMPSIEIVGSREPDVPWLLQPMLSTGANPAHIAIELTSHARAGLSIPDAEWDVEKMQTFADWCAANGLGLNIAMISPVMLPSFYSDLAAYFDGWLTDDGGRMGFSSLYYDRDFSTSPIIEAEHLSEPVKPKVDAYAGAYTHCVLTWTNPAKNFGKDTATAHMGGAHNLLGHLNPLKLDRQWITDQALANKMATIAARRGDLPRVGGTVRMLARYAKDVAVGGPFRLRPRPGATFLLNCICQRKTHQGPDSREVEVEYMQDATNFTQSAYVPASYEPDVEEDPGAEPALAERVMEMPRPLRAPGATALTAALIAARSHSLINGGIAWMSLDDTTYAALGPFGLYAATGTLTNDVVPGDIAIALDMDTVDMLEIVSQTVPQAEADTVLVLINDEIISLEGYNLTGAASVSLDYPQRGRFDTVAGYHAAGSRVFILPRAWLSLAADPSFIEAAELWFKLTPSTAVEQLGLEDADALDLTFVGRENRPIAPKQFTVNGADSAPTFTVAVNDEMVWQLKTWGDLGYPGSDFYAAASLEVALKIYAADGVTLKRTENLAAGTTTYNYTAAHRVADFGVEPASYVVKVWTKLSGVLSAFPAIHPVTKNP